MGKKQKATGGDAVIYARYSSHNQRDVSIEQQVEACRKHAAELGLTVTATYEDRAISRQNGQAPLFPAYDARCRAAQVRLCAGMEKQQNRPAT